MGNLLPQRKKQDLEALIVQLNKDMALSGLTLELPILEDMKTLHQMLSKELHYTIQVDFDRYLNFLYRVDLDQREAQIGENKDAKSYADEIALKVIIRELEKIDLRNKTL